MKFGIIILAGGKGKRMNSDLPKVLHKLNGKPLLKHIIDVSKKLNPEGIGVIVGEYSKIIQSEINDSEIEYILQESPKGTGHALQCAEEFIKRFEKVLVLSGDVPLITEETLNKMINVGFDCTLLVNEMEDPTGYGRIIRNTGKVSIIEEKDCSLLEKQIKEVNSGIYCFKSEELLIHLHKLECNNAQSEYYLTDLIKYFDVQVVKTENKLEIKGINTKEQLDELNKLDNQIKVGVIGLGFVGSSILKSLKLMGCDIKGYDIAKESDTFQETVESDILFLALPTVYDAEKKEYDKSCIIEVLKNLENCNYTGLVVIKSTVEPKTTDKLANKFKILKLVHNPEFLTAATAFEDFHNQKHIVLGKSNNVSDKELKILEEFYNRYYKDTLLSVCTCLESESMKIFCNCFYSVKIQFFNELYLLCQKTKCDYSVVKELMLKNDWINPMHTVVPGMDGKLSYGGYCFPKDTNALLEYMRSQESPHLVLEATILERNKMRDDNTNCNIINKQLKYDTLSNKKILITGGAGFIGSNITESLLIQGVKKVRVVDNLVTGKMENIKFLLDKYENLEFMYGDISNLETCRKAVKDMDIICNQAALGSVPRSVNDPLSSHYANVNGFLNILIAAKEEGIKRVVYASSSSVYGDNPDLPKVEENTGNVLSPYAATKAIDEIYSGVFTKCYGMECIGLRYFNIFGPRQDPNGAYAAVIPKFIDLMKNGKQPTINGNGTFSRDFTYVENAVQANILAMTIENTECYGEAFNIGAGGQYSLLELISILNKELKTNIEPIFGPNRPGDIPHSNANISKAQQMLGYVPKISFEIGISKLLISNNNNNNNNIFNIYNFNYNKLLNRKEINIDNFKEIDYLNNKTVLVTGGFGSIGSEIVRNLVKHNVTIIIYDNNECNCFYLKTELVEYKNITYIIGCINNFKKLENLFLNNKIDLVYHVAAYKHVPIMEYNEYESVKVNIIGVKNVADLSVKYNVKKFILVSTDKAVNPSNIMGCCKRVSEIYISYLWNKYKTTNFIVTRFGNVLGSSGSVLPVFFNRIRQNKNLQLTDRNITRFFMTISEASKLVILSSCICNDNNKVLFDMGSPIKIYDLIKTLLKYLKREDLKIDIIGLRPGEKLYEDLYYTNEIKLETKYEKILLLKTEDKIEIEEFIKKYNDLINIKCDSTNIRNLLKKLVPESSL